MGSNPRNATPSALAFSALALGCSQPARADVAPEPPWIPAVDVRVVVADFGEFVIRLDRHRAPNAVSAFLSLAARDAYDGLAFHRTIPGFLVQTGDPLSRDEDPANDGSAVPPWRIAADESPPSHRRGTVSMAWRADRPESAGMEWFVLLADVPHLDGKATPIGEVVEGLDVLDRVAQVSTFRNRRPVRPVRITDVRLEAAKDSAPPTTPPAVEDGATPDSARESSAGEAPPKES